MDVDGSNQKQLTTLRGYDGSPIWSGDGQNIAFISNRNGSYQLWMMDADGRNQRQLLPHDFSSNVESPAWSPDGQKIAFEMPSPLTDHRANPADIWVIDADGSNLTQLTTGPGYDSDPNWSPDGQKIVFTSERGGNRDVWVMDLRGFLHQNEIPTENLSTAVIEFDEKGSLGIDDAGAIVSDWMSRSLHKTNAFDLFERVLLAKVLAEQNLGLTGALKQETVARIGEVYGVQAIVTGTISKFGNTVSVVAKLIDTETAKVISTADVKTTNLDALPNMMDQLARQLVNERQ